MNYVVSYWLKKNTIKPARSDNPAPALSGIGVKWPSCISNFFYLHIKHHRYLRSNDVKRRPLPRYLDAHTSKAYAQPISRVQC